MLFSKRDEEIPDQPIEADRIYRGNGFTINQLSDWQDKTIHTLVGPMIDGIQHNIIIMIDENVPFDSVLQYADMQVTALENELKGFLLLKREETILSNGYPAHKIIFRWFPTDELCVYQEQLFILVNSTAYKLITTFSKKSRKIMGPEIDRILKSFQPDRF